MPGAATTEIISLFSICGKFVPSPLVCSTSENPLLLPSSAVCLLRVLFVLIVTYPQCLAVVPLPGRFALTARVKAEFISGGSRSASLAWVRGRVHITSNVPNPINSTRTKSETENKAKLGVTKLGLDQELTRTEPDQIQV